MDINQLPKELQRLIVSFLTYPQIHTAKLIKNEINYYNKDHNWPLTKMYGKYYVCNILSFSVYYFDFMYDPFDYQRYYSNYSEETQ